MDENEFVPTIKQAEILPEGWEWDMYGDGSGSLKSPEGKSYFSYDKAPYANAGWIEYQEEKGKGWSVFQDDFSEFQKYAEECVLKTISKEPEKEEFAER